MSTTAQREMALGKANEIRLCRAAVKRAVRAGLLNVEDALAEPCCASMRVFDLVAAQHRWANARTSRLFAELNSCGVPIGPSRTVRDLTGRQREALVARLRGKRRQ